jgi:hypothetical protein
MRQRLLSHLTYANVMVTILAFIVLGGGTALAAYVVSSNSQVGPGTISGHKPPSGDHSNLIAGSVNGTDLAKAAVGSAQLKAPEPWHNVGAGSSTQDLCADASNTGVFCGFDSPAPGSWRPWVNYGSPFATAGFYKDQLGIVHLKGLVSTGLEHFISEDPKFLPIFRLPPAYAPASERVFPTVGRNDFGQEISQGRVDVNPDGLVVFGQDCAPSQTDCSADGTYVSLDAISFRPDG